MPPFLLLRLNYKKRGLDMFTVTTETIADKRIREVKGAIFNEQVISINIVKDTISGIKGIFAENLLLILMNIQAEGNWLF